LEFNAKRQPKIIGSFHVAINGTADNVQVARAKFVKGRNAFYEMLLRVWDVVLPTLSEENVSADASRKAIIAVWIAIGLFSPKLVRENSIKI
jgi:nuclear transport factor 2 (NTF2) superfamily protein